MTEGGFELAAHVAAEAARQLADGAFDTFLFAYETIGGERHLERLASDDPAADVATARAYLAQHDGGLVACLALIATGEFEDYACDVLMIVLRDNVTGLEIEILLPFDRDTSGAPVFKGDVMSTGYGEAHTAFLAGVEIFRMALLRHPAGALFFDAEEPDATGTPA